MNNSFLESILTWYNEYGNKEDLNECHKQLDYYIRNVVTPNGDEYYWFMSWCSNVLFKDNFKDKTVVILQGENGNEGKSTFVDKVFSHVPGYTWANSNISIKDKEKYSLIDKKICLIDEGFDIKKIRDISHEDDLTHQARYKSPVLFKNNVNFLCITNEDVITTIRGTKIFKMRGQNIINFNLFAFDWQYFVMYFIQTEV